jgi:hypothetical protein
MAMVAKELNAQLVLVSFIPFAFATELNVTLLTPRVRPSVFLRRIVAEPSLVVVVGKVFANVCSEGIAVRRALNAVVGRHEF